MTAWTAEERAVVKELRWWPPHELASSPELILPGVLRDLLPAVVRGEYPSEPIEIALGP